MLFPSNRSRKDEIETAETASRRGYAASEGEPRGTVSLSAFTFFMVHQREVCNGAIHSHQERNISQRGFFWHRPSRSCQRAPRSCPERASPLVILSIFNPLRSGRALTRDVYVTPLLSLPTIFCLFRMMWQFPEPREREQRIEHHIYSLLLHCTPSPQRRRPLAHRSLLPRERAHSINVADEFHGSVIKWRGPGTAIYTSVAFEEQNCREQLPALPELWQVPTLGVLIPLLMGTHLTLGEYKKGSVGFLFKQSKNGKAVHREHGKTGKKRAKKPNRIGALSSSTFFTIKV